MLAIPFAALPTTYRVSYHVILPQGGCKTQPSNATLYHAHLYARITLQDTQILEVQHLSWPVDHGRVSRDVVELSMNSPSKCCRIFSAQASSQDNL